eukprot:TRINITY_DN81054_c0_g1_i1.p2 TRINITY_DN81054_c0_g1~~TRINITY_DN81054_c0_g1_i1.p2  ORF type:complete len:166 (+),score=3.91 TRINITY_DN81054_c0_g1_i1:155-652(+)
MKVARTGSRDVAHATRPCRWLPQRGKACRSLCAAKATQLDRAGNLGELTRFTEGASTSQAESWSYVTPTDYSPGPLNVDGFAIFGTTVLFLVLVATGFGRIAGLDVWVDRALERLQERRERRIQDLRVSLEKQWQNDETRDSQQCTRHACFRQHTHMLAFMTRVP